MLYDVVIIGGGPAGLSAALMLGRGRKRVLLCDAGPPRNAAAERVHNFMSRDGTPPAELRRIAREQLAPYESVAVRDARVGRVDGERGRFHVEVDGDVVASRRVLVCTGMIDEPPELPGYRELWGKAVFQCPYCHGWEVRDRAFGLIASEPHLLEWSMFLRGWSRDVVVFTDGKLEVPAELRARLAGAGVRVEERGLRRLVPRTDHDARHSHLEAVELADGTRIARDVIFAHPRQRQTAVVTAMELDLDDQGFVRVNERRETSRPGIYAAGDLTTRMQGAILAAAAGVAAAAMLNAELTIELAAQGALP